MSRPGASSGEMPEQTLLRLFGGEPDEPLLEKLLAGQPLPGDAPEQLHEVAGLLASLTAPAAPGPLTGEAAARSAFASAAASPVRAWPVARVATRTRRPRLYIRRNARLAAALAAVTVSLGAGAAAYAGALPGPIQDFAHHLIGAPAAHHAPGGRREGARLCSAYERAKVSGGARARAAALRKLGQAAGGPGKIGAYCARAGRPGLAPADPRASRPMPQPAKPPNPSSHRKAASHGKPKGRRSPADGKANAHGNAKDHGKAEGPPGASR